MKNLLLNAKHEIERLRRENQLLHAKVEVVEVFKAALLGPQTPMGMSIDVAWELQRAVEQIDKSEVQPSADAPQSR